MKKALLIAAVAAFTYCIQAHALTPLADGDLATAAGESAYSSSFLAVGVKEKLKNLLDTVLRAPTTEEILQILSEVGTQNRVKFEIIMFNEKLVPATAKLPQEIESIGCNVLDLDGNQIGLIRLRGLSLEGDGIDIGIK